MKKNSYVEYLCVFTFVLSTLFCYSQAVNNENLNLPNITPLSPEAASFAKYGNIPVSQFRGMPNISLPLMSISDRGLTHNIGLSYHSGGVKVSESASSVGMSWTLNAGGMITRQVRGVRDESTSPIGYLHAKDINTYNNQDIVNVWMGTLDNESDIFTFNVGGISGKFQFDQNGNAHVFPYRNIKIEPSSEFKSGNPNYWEITMENGTRYRFGETGRVETTSFEPNCGGASNTSFISGWYITSIESYKGEKIEFVYDTRINQDSFTGISETVQIQHINTNPQIFNGTPSVCISTLSVNAFPLKEIKSSTQLITLSRSPRLDMIAGGYKIDNIKLSEGVNKPVLKRFDFEYFYTTASTWIYNSILAKRMYLSSIKQKNNLENVGIEQYKFDYFQPENLPSRISKSQDAKGFYNGKTNSSLIPYSPTFTIGGDRSTSQIDNHLKYGSLSAMHYPTGGKTVFNFEPNEENGVNVGGLRIGSIEDHDNNGNVQTRNYDYHFFGNTSSTSSMLFNASFQYFVTDMTHFYIPINTDGGVGGLATDQISYTIGRSNPTTPSGSINGGHIGYANVTETLGNGSYSEFSFSFVNDFVSGQPNGARTSMDFARGQLLKTSLYAAGGVKVKEIINEYEVNDTYRASTGTVNAASVKNLIYTTPLTQKNYSYGVLGLSLPAFINRYFEIDHYEDLSAWVYLKSKRDISYYNGTPVETKTDYTYGNPTHAQLTQTTVTTSNNENLVTKSYYANDLNNNTLINQHRIAEPLKVESLKGITLLSTQETTYLPFGSNYLPSKVKSSKGLGVLEDRLVFHGYYANGNVKEVSKQDGTHIVYIWGYNESQPIAKIENAIFNDIPSSVYTSILNASNLDSNTSTENTLRVELSKLRNASYCPNLSKSQITTYTYDPLIGVTSITDPRGKTVYYQYDSFNRLEYVKDQDGKILKKNEYHYKN